MSEMKYTYWCCKAEFGEHEETCPNYKSECAPDSMQRVVPNAATSDVPVTREPPHSAEQVLAKLSETVRGMIKQVSKDDAASGYYGDDSRYYEGKEFALEEVLEEIEQLERSTP